MDLFSSHSFIRALAPRARRQRVWILRYAFPSICADAKHLGLVGPSSSSACTWRRHDGGGSHRLAPSDMASVARMAKAPVPCEVPATSSSPKGRTCVLHLIITWICFSFLFVVFLLQISSNKVMNLTRRLLNIDSLANYRNEVLLLLSRLFHLIKILKLVV